MKKMFFLTLLSATLLFACTKTDDLSFGDIFDIKMGQTVTVSNIQIRLDSVQDSRCPTGAVCVRAGEAIAKLTFIKSNEQITKYLQVVGLANSPQPDSTVVYGKKAVLLNVSPYPNVNSPTSQSDYKVQMKLE